MRSNPEKSFFNPGLLRVSRAMTEENFTAHSTKNDISHSWATSFLKVQRVSTLFKGGSGGIFLWQYLKIKMMSNSNNHEYHCSFHHLRVK
jgi:hypothetical protein